MIEKDKEYSQEEVVAYAVWSTDIMLNKGSCNSKDKKDILETFKKELNSLIRYDKKEHKAVSVLRDIDNRK